MAALCYECRGGSSRIPCTAPGCPLYAFLPEPKQGGGEARRWWEAEVSNWNTLSQVARGLPVDKVVAGEDPSQGDLFSGNEDEDEDGDEGDEGDEEVEG